MSITVEPFYPDPSSYTNNRLVTDTEAEKLFRETLFKERSNDILNQKRNAESRLKHLKKIKKRWNKADNILRYGGFSLFVVSGGVATILASLVTAGFAIPSLAILVVSASSVMHTGIMEVISAKLTSKNTSKYRKRIKEIKSYIDKMYVYFEKARSNGDISNK